jgi:hypothetical protein
MLKTLGFGELFIKVILVLVHKPLHQMATLQFLLGLVPSTFLYKVAVVAVVAVAWLMTMVVVLAVAAVAAVQAHLLVTFLLQVALYMQ